MSELYEVSLLAFYDELEKTASRAQAVRLLARAGQTLQSATRGAGTSLSNFGQRQLHSLTGWTPSGGLQSIGGSPVADVQKQLSNATKPGVRARLQKALPHAQEAERMGLTSIPGYAKSLVTNPGKTLSTGFKHQWHSSGPLGKAMAVGFPAVSVGASALEKETEDGPGKGENVGAALGNLAYMTPIPFVGQTALSVGLGEAGKRIGRGVDYLRGRRKKPQGTLAPPSSTALESSSGQAGPSETIIGSGVMGSPYSGPAGGME